jgi:hypothetical protein
MACMELREFVGLRAENERQLAQLLDEVPLDSIYYHTHGFLLRHRLVTGIYPNDFATWVDVQVRDRVLGERLAMVDPADFTTLQALREELVSVVDEHLRRSASCPRSCPGPSTSSVTDRRDPDRIEVRTLRSSGRPARVDRAHLLHLVEAGSARPGANDFAARLGAAACGARPGPARQPSTRPASSSPDRVLSRCSTRRSPRAPAE